MSAVRGCQPSPGSLLGSLLRPSVSDERACYLAAIELARQAAPVIGASEAYVFDALTFVPDNLLDLLRSPEGWTALASFIAVDFGCAMNAYAPTVH